MASLLVGAGIGLVGNLATGTVRVEAGWWGPAVWTATGVLIVAAVLLGWLSSRPGPFDPGVVEDRAVAALRVRVRGQWEHEAVVRRLRQPMPLRVTWSSTGRPVAAAREAVLDEPNLTWEERPFTGDTGQIVGRFRQLQHRQLVILGEGGAGKSVLALLLTLGLLEDPVEGEPLPVLLPVAAWSPGKESVAEFAARRVAEDYPDAVGAGDGRDVARRLVEQGRLLLVLDGLDEISSALHAAAVRKLDEYAAAGRQLVVTCRSREFDTAVQAGGHIVSRAAVVELQPVTPDLAIAFLSHPATSRPRWQKVFSHMKDEPGGALASVLTTPLMVSLARVAYQRPSTDPGELLRAGGRIEIRAKLMDTYLDSVHDPDHPASPVGAPLRRYTPDAARRYLQTLALNLELSGTVELVWWQWRPDLYTRHVHLAGTCLAVGLTALAALAVTPVAGVWGGICAAIVVGGAFVLASSAILRLVWPHNHPAYQPATYRPARIRRRQTRWARAAVGAWCSLFSGLILSDVATAALGAVCSALCWAWLPTDRIKPQPRTATPGATLAAHHRATLNAAILNALPGATITATTTMLTSRHSPAETAFTALLVYGWTAACPGGLWTWLRYRATHLHLALRHRLPPRLHGFLRDQHQRGTLRQTGTTWQLRHLILQQHLAHPARLHHLRARADQGDDAAARQLAELLAGEGRAEEAITILRVRADQGHRHTARQLAELLVREGRAEEAIAFLRVRADQGDDAAARQLVELLAREGRAEELRARADQGDRYAARQLVELFAREGRVKELRARADQGDRYAARQLVELFAREGRVKELRARADQGDGHAARQLVELFAREGRVKELRARADQGDRYAARQLVELLAGEGRAEEAITVLRVRADQGDRYAAWQLVELLVREGRAEEAITFLRVRADQGDDAAARQLAELLAGEGRAEEAITVLRARADQGDDAAARQLAELLAREGRAEEAITVLRVRADQGDRAAAGQLVELLAREGRAEEAITVLRVRADQGDRHTARQLVELLAREGRAEELRARADQGDRYAARQLVELFAREGRAEEAITVLRARADQGDDAAARQLAELLAGEGRAEEAITVLRVHADQGDRAAARQLVELLAGEGRAEEAIAFLRVRADQGDRHTARQLVELLAGEGRAEEAITVLRVRADQGDRYAAWQLVELLVREGRAEEAITFLRARADQGEHDAAWQLAELLVQEGRVEELRARADQGDHAAAWHLAKEP
ncbi:NACHT domain-containing protein [Sphaerisporangium sp. NPDC005288]|uniref:NACHT domain-containing protein n=1 Tax=Sphaerisporangium sp. NPDC005288 TaxID=3155114 RepID=UPI0033AC7F12